MTCKKTLKLKSLDDPLLNYVIKTATSSKLDGKFISDLIIQAIRLLNSKGRSDLKNGIMLLRRLGNDHLINGIAIEELPMEPEVIRNINKPVICLLKDTLKLPITSNVEEDRNKIISTILLNNINIIITNAPEIDKILKFNLEEKNVAIIRVSTEELTLLSKALQLKILNNLDLLKEKELSRKSMDSISLNEEDNLTILNNAGGNVSATLIIGGITDETSKERMRTFTDGISAAHFAMEGGILPGGGIAELNCARFLKKYMLENNIEKPGYKVLISGFESISRQILENAGYNGYEMLMQLNQQPDGIGINIDTGDYIDMINNGIVDPYIVKVSAINAAVHITKTILKI
ncbi:TCP-1/cpn60 chaperonin family protein, partial [Acidiplasma cupricumulans]|uniref:TCP-1/cpn60 chaperonin family protein n=1 Tax=Acidiplasma cupricumulans TaxID=312540 RepID=UPI0015859CDA